MRSSRFAPLALVAFAAGGIACGLSVVGGVDSDTADDAGPDGSSALADGASPPDGNTIGDASDGDALAASDAAGEADAPVVVACPELADGGAVLDGHCYFPLTTLLDQPAALEACKALNAHLVTITTLEEQTLVAKVGTGDRWIGLAAPAKTNDRSSYVWCTGEDAGQSFWYPNDPDNGGPCVALHGTLEQWVDRGCTDTYPSICERE